MLACTRYFEWACCSSGLCRPPRPRVLHHDRAVIVMGGLVPLPPAQVATLSGVSVPFGHSPCPSPRARGRHRPPSRPRWRPVPMPALGWFGCQPRRRCRSRPRRHRPASRVGWPQSPRHSRRRRFDARATRRCGRGPWVVQPSGNGGRAEPTHPVGPGCTAEKVSTSVQYCLSFSDVRAEPRPTRRFVQCPKTPQSLTHLPK